MGVESDMAVLRRFRGLYDTGNNTPDPQGLASRFSWIRPRDHEKPPVTQEMVIRDEESFSRFIDRIPKYRMAIGANPGLSDDPLLQRPQVAFDRHMVLAITSHDPNRFVDLQILGVELKSGTLRVLCRFSPPGPVVPKVISYGRYVAALVYRFDGEVVFAQS